MNTAERLATMRRTYEHATTPAEDAMAPAWSTHDFMQNCAPRLLDAVEAVLEVCEDIYQGDPFEAADQAIREIRAAITTALKEQP